MAHKYEASPASDRSLDQRRRSSATGSVSGHRNSNGGYYVDVSVDPTMNLPHNKSHPTTPSSLTPRNSTSAGDKGSNFTHRGSISGVANISALRSNSIIQITTDERGSILSMGRASVSSLPSKSMNIPHHQLGNNSLAHLPVLFGGTGSISGPSRHSSVSGGSVGGQQTTLPSLRVVVSLGPTLDIFSVRLGRDTTHCRQKEEEPFKFDKERLEASNKNYKRYGEICRHQGPKQKETWYTDPQIGYTMDYGRG